jgi:hypothetical protein
MIQFLLSHYLITSLSHYLIISLSYCFRIEVEDFPIETTGPKEKKSRVEDNDYSEFKHLFLACLPFMNLKQIANICAGSQVPIYAVV